MVLCSIAMCECCSHPNPQQLSKRLRFLLTNLLLTVFGMLFVGCGNETKSFTDFPDMVQHKDGWQTSLNDAVPAHVLAGPDGAPKTKSPIDSRLAHLTRYTWRSQPVTLADGRNVSPFHQWFLSVQIFRRQRCLVGVII